MGEEACEAEFRAMAPKLTFYDMFDASEINVRSACSCVGARAHAVRACACLGPTRGVRANTTSDCAVKLQRLQPLRGSWVAEKRHPHVL